MFINNFSMRLTHPFIMSKHNSTPLFGALLSYKYITTHSTNGPAKTNADTKLNGQKPLIGDDLSVEGSSHAGMIFEDYPLYALVLENCMRTELQFLGVDVDLFLSTKIDGFSYVSTTECLQSVIDFHNSKIKHMGIVGGTTFYNKVRDYSVTLLETNVEGHKNVPNPCNISTGCADRWPSAFKDLRFLFRWQRSRSTTSHIADRMIRSIISINRIKSDNSEINTESITMEGKVLPDDFIEDFKSFLRKFLKPVVCTTNVNWPISPFLKLGKSGPSGKDSVESAGLEAGLLTHLENWDSHFRPLCELTGNSCFYTYVKELGRTSLEEALGSPDRCNNNTLKSELRKGRLGKVNLRKIVPVPDKGNKSRIVAMSDKFTQHLLSGFEDRVLNVTQRLFRKECDYYSHKAGFNKLSKQLKAGLNSYDLTSWTDRLPASLQVLVVSELFGSKIAEHWESLVVKCPWKLGTSQKTIKYSVGQGMGTKGSFQIASLTSMLLIKYTYVRKYGEKLTQFKYPRSAVGDDLFAFDPQGHIPKLFELLGMPVNQKKSKIATEENLVGEYVSRNINYGKDVSRISAKLCLSVRDDLTAVKSLLLHLEERDCHVNIAQLFRDLLSLKRKHGTSRFKPWELIRFWKSQIVQRVLYNDTHSLKLAITLFDVLQEETLLNEEEIEFYDLVTKNEEYWYTILSSSILDAKESINAISDAISPPRRRDECFQTLVQWYSSQDTSVKGCIPKFPWESLDPSLKYGDTVAILREARLESVTQNSFEIGAGLNSEFFDRKLKGYTNGSIEESVLNTIFIEFIRDVVRRLEKVTLEFGLIPHHKEIHDGVPKYRLRQSLKVAQSFNELSDLEHFYREHSFQKRMILDDVVKHYCLTVLEESDTVS